MTHHHLSHSVTQTLSCREIYRLSKTPFLRDASQKHHDVPMCLAGLPQRASFFPFPFPLMLALENIIA